jgi:hypothetical protein
VLSFGNENWPKTYGQFNHPDYFCKIISLKTPEVKEAKNYAD